MRLKEKRPDWVLQAHGLSDDIDANEGELLAELAGVLESWPAENVVTRKALHRAALELVDLARATPLVTRQPDLGVSLI